MVRPHEGRASRLLGWFLVLPIVAAALYGIVAGGHPQRLGQAVLSGAEALTIAVGFSLDRVTVEGRSETERQAILDALGARAGQSILSFDCRAARERLLLLDWVSDARVLRLLPDRIHVEIVEHTPIAVWQHEGRLSLISATGLAIVGVDDTALERYPHVVGAGAPAHAAALLDVLRRFPEIESRVRAAVRVGDRRWNLQLKNAIEIELPAEGVEEALAELVRLDRERGVLSRDIKAVDMRLKDRLILRLPSGSAEIKPGASRAT